MKTKLQQYKQKEYQKKKSWFRNYKKDKSCNICDWKVDTDLLETLKIEQKELVNGHIQTAFCHGCSIPVMEERIKDYLLLCPTCNKILKKYRKIKEERNERSKTTNN